MILMKKQNNIVYIPKEEIKINPDIKFYDVEQSKLNPYEMITTKLMRLLKLV
jgi:hypothetical protein